MNAALYKNKFVFFAVIVVFGVLLDQWTKVVAVEELASRTTRWDHRIERTVDTDEDTTVGAWLDATFGEGTTTREPREVFGIYIVQAEGDAIGPVPDSHPLDAGATVQIGHRQTTIVDGFWNHVYVQNYGAAWGFLSNRDTRFVRPFFLIVSIFAIGIVLNIFRQIRPDQSMLLWALPLIVSGAVGNFIDRARLGYVVDFVDWYVTSGGAEKHWPTFNIADVWITIGVALMILEIIFGKDDATYAAEQEAAAPEEDPSAPAAA